MQRTIKAIGEAFRRGVIPQSNPHFNVETLPDMRQRLSLKSNLARAGVTRVANPRPMLVQTVAHILFAETDLMAMQTVLDLDTAQLAGARNGVGFIDDNYLDAVRAIDPDSLNPDNPYTKKSLLAYWFWRVPINGVFLYLDSIKFWFPALASLDVSLNTLTAGIDVKIYHDGRNYHSGAALVNQGGELLQHLTSSAASATLSYDFTTGLATLT